VGADCARIDQRGAHAEFADMPGGTTGLLIKDRKGKGVILSARDSPPSSGGYGHIVSV
jgi:hypothetical protein